MNSVRAMNIEIRSQPQQLASQPLPARIENNHCVFVGSGDSYAAALIARYASNLNAIACCPSDLLSNPKILENRNAYFISVSGNTKSNILAAKLAKKKNSKTVAITHNPTSELAQACDDVIELNYKNSGIGTSGTIGFTSSLLVCLSLLVKIDSLHSIRRIFQESIYQSQRLFDTRKYKSYFMLGDGILFPIALYGAFKVNEIFGAKSTAYPLDEFFHAPIFSLHKDDQIVILDNGVKCRKRINPFRDGNTNLDVPAIYFNCNSGPLLDTLLRATFFIQLLLAKKAVEQRITDCYFIKKKDLLRLSSGRIYSKLNCGN